MPKRSSRPDLNQLAAAIVAEATEEAEPIETEETPEKNQAAVEIGRLGGLKGGKARADKLTAAQRSEIARLAAFARWRKSD